MLEHDQEIMEAAEKPGADFADVLGIGEFIPFLMAPSIGPGLVDLDIELVPLPFRGERRRLLLLPAPVRRARQTLRGQEGGHTAARFAKKLSSFQSCLLFIGD